MEAKPDQEELGGRLEDAGVDIHWLAPVLGGLGVIGVSLAGAWLFWWMIVR